MSSKKARSAQPELQSAAVELFKKTFEGRHPEVVAMAPGRVNLIGEHTDYSQGYCLPVAIPLATICCIGRAPQTAGTKCTLVSVQSSSGETVSFEVGKNAEAEWGKYVAGVAAQYGLDFPIEASFVSDVPLGGGLSSSASLDVSFATALEGLLNREKKWDPAERALKCVEGDHTFVGVPCGIMDQFASSCCKIGHALLIDCMSNTGTLVSFNDPSVCLVVTNTNVTHSHSGGEYGARVKECKAAATELKVPYLREVTDVSQTDIITDEVVRKRARHVVSENARTLLAAKAAETKDWVEFGKLMNESHDSLQKDFEVSCPELDFLSSTARQYPGVYGSRMTGGGFGGCIVSLVKREQAEGLVELLGKMYHEQFPGLHCTSYVFLNPGDGATIVY